MREEEQVRWDVTLPASAKSGREGKVKTAISAFVLFALLAGPALVSHREEGPKIETAAVGEVGPVRGTAGNGEDAEVIASKVAADSAGIRYERCFPGRQAM